MPSSSDYKTRGLLRSIKATSWAFRIAQQAPRVEGMTMFGIRGNACLQVQHDAFYALRLRSVEASGGAMLLLVVEFGFVPFAASALEGGDRRDDPFA